MKVSTKNEYGELKSVILGRAEHACWPKGDIFFDRMLSLSTYKGRPRVGPIDPKVIEEATDDLLYFTDVLRDEGVEVYRPEITDWSRTVASVNHVTTGMHCYSARDLLLSVGDMIIECPTPFISRQHEHIAFQQIKQQAMQDGCRWIAAPVAPMESAECLVRGGRVQLTERYPIFDAANVLKFDDKLLYLVSSTGNLAGARWLQSVVGTEFEVVVWDNVYPFAHIDSTLLSLNHNTIMVNAQRVSGEQIPKFLRSHNKVWVHDCREIPFHRFPYASKWIGMNTLMLNPEAIFVDPAQVELIGQVRDAGFRVIEVQMRHARTLGGGFHCVTCDLERS